MAMIFPIERWYHNFPWYIFTVGVWLYAVYFFNRFLTVPALFRGGRFIDTGVGSGHFRTRPSQSLQSQAQYT